MCVCVCVFVLLTIGSSPRPSPSFPSPLDLATALAAQWHSWRSVRHIDNIDSRHDAHTRARPARASAHFFVARTPPTSTRARSYTAHTHVPRLCAGVVLIKLLQHFEMELPPTIDPDYQDDPAVGLTLNPRSIRLVPKARSSIPLNTSASLLSERAISADMKQA